MKLILKNFSGKLKNGTKYRIIFKSKPIDGIDEFMLTLSVYTNTFEFAESWLYDVKLSVSNFYKKEQYVECLRKSLTELEEKLEVQLLKSEMSIAV